MDEKQFKASYIAQFLASYMAQLYDKGHLRHLAPATYQPVEDAVRSTRRKIIEEVFGEFRPMLYQLNEAAHQRDWAAINRVLKQMYDTMFEEGL